MLGDKIKTLRNEKGIYQQELAEALSVSKSTVAMWETNKREPDLLTLKKIAEFFKVSIDFLASDMIKFDFTPSEFEDESILKCPVCGYEYTHFCRTLAVDFDNEKSTGIAIEFQCEAEHYFYLVLETYKGNTYLVFADEHCNINFEKNFYTETAPVSLSELFENESFKQKKYRTLDKHGKRMIDIVLNEECNRCMSITEEDDEEPEIEIKHSYYKVSAGTGFDLDSDDDWETISIPDTPEARKADFALTIQGNSMEPVYFNGDIVLVKEQPAIDIGQIGIFIIEGNGYIKKYDGDRLISLNAEYEDIIFAEHDEDRIRCVGRVIGRA